MLAIDAFRYYDATTPVSHTTPTGRTYAIVRLSKFSDPGAELNLAMGPGYGLNQVRQLRFGTRVFVVLLEPRS